MSVYGIKNGVINKETLPKPDSAYGTSKLEAEKLINELYDDFFTVSILRPPMVYGKGCKGNYPKLATLALKTPVFPDVDNKRSMIYIENLTEFIKQLIDKRSGGLFFPQNAEYVNTCAMVKLITQEHNKRVVTTKFFNPLVMRIKATTINKVFGDLVYDMSMSEFENDYQVFGFRESIAITEEGRE